MKRPISIIQFCTALALILQAACARTPKPAATEPTAPSPTAITLVEPTRSPGCSVVSRRPATDPSRESPVAAVGEGDWTLGPADAALTILNYCDFQSPACAYVSTALTNLARKYPDDLRLVFRHYPLTSLYDKSTAAVQAVEAAGRQGKFWQMHDLLYARQVEWAQLDLEAFEAWLMQRAGELKLDPEKFEADFGDPELARLAQDADQSNAALGMTGTPFLFFNGEAYQGPPNIGDLEAIVSLTALEKRQFSDCPPMTIDAGKQYLAVIHTEKGDLTLELFADKAPLAVNNFVFLARQGWYNGVTFHRVLPNFMAQTGDPTGTGFGGPGYGFENEVSDLRFDGPGMVGMANAGPGTNGSQFFITYAAAPHLNGDFTIFGRLIAGMDTLEKLTPRDPSKSGSLPPGDRILEVEIQEK